MAKQAVVRHFAKACLDVLTDAELSGEAAEAAIKVAALVPKMRTADLLWSSPDQLPLYVGTIRDLLSFLVPLWQNVEFAAFSGRLPVYF